MRDKGPIVRRRLDRSATMCVCRIISVTADASDTSVLTPIMNDMLHAKGGSTYRLCQQMPPAPIPREHAVGVLLDVFKTSGSPERNGHS